MPETKSERVAVLGASTNPNRYSYKAIEALAAQGHQPLPVNPNETEVLGRACFPDLASIPGTVDTITVYLSPQRTTPLVEAIVAATPKRVIFNPGAENPVVAEACRKANIRVVEACTLVLLRTHQF